MQRLTVLIADDEPLARARLRALLAGRRDVRLIGDCGDGWETLAEIRRQCPDIAILDMRMPGLTGIDLLRKMPPEHRPTIIVASAHQEHAVDAFAEEVADYLLKPFDGERLGLALDRASARVRARRAVASEVGNLLGAAAPAGRGESLCVRADGRIVFLRPAEIAWVEAVNNYCLVHLPGRSRLMVRGTLQWFENRLGGGFVRVNRSALVSREQIRELLPRTFGDYTVLLACGARLPLSRRLRGRFRRSAP